MLLVNMIFINIPVCLCLGRDRDVDLPADDAIVDVVAPFKEPVEMTIGVGMELAIPGTYIYTDFLVRLEHIMFM